jgi:hypothetical protein
MEGITEAFYMAMYKHMTDTIYEISDVQEFTIGINDVIVHDR